jgi:hypothetical protein
MPQHQGRVVVAGPEDRCPQVAVVAVVAVEEALLAVVAVRVTPVLQPVHQRSTALPLRPVLLTQ